MTRLSYELNVLTINNRGSIYSGPNDAHELTWGTTRTDGSTLSDTTAWIQALSLDNLLESHGRVQMFVGNDQHDDGFTNSPRLTEQWEQNSSAIVLDFPTVGRLVIPGPDFFDNETRSTSAPYGWRPSPQKRQDIDEWVGKVWTATNADRTLRATVTFDDEPTVKDPVPVTLRRQHGQVIVTRALAQLTYDWLRYLAIKQGMLSPNAFAVGAGVAGRDNLVFESEGLITAVDGKLTTLIAPPTGRYELVVVNNRPEWREL